KKEVVQALKISGGTVTDAVWWDAKPIIATSSGHIKVFQDLSNGGDATHLGSHAGAVSAIALHPSGDLLASVGVDKTYKLFDLTSMKLVSQVVTPSGLSHNCKLCSHRSMLT
ncbi:MAG: hypothetical protein INR71_11340, partial [Terriglobus roseus]|nr:hypothetical protein [Terriglobus roseus]